MNEEEIIKPIPKEVLMSELTHDKQLRMTNKSNNEISKRTDIFSSSVQIKRWHPKNEWSNDTMINNI